MYMKLLVYPSVWDGNEDTTCLHTVPTQSTSVIGHTCRVRSVASLSLVRTHPASRLVTIKDNHEGDCSGRVASFPGFPLRMSGARIRFMRAPLVLRGKPGNEATGRAR